MYYLTIYYIQNRKHKSFKNNYFQWIFKEIIMEYFSDCYSARNTFGTDVS